MHCDFKVYIIIPLFFISALTQDKVKTLLNNNDLHQVQNQYTNLPYPFVNEKSNERHSFPTLIGPYIHEINHFIFGGNGDLGKRKLFRILIAGGGTGSSLLHYAYIFKNRQVEFVYLDFSKASMEIARNRANNFGFTNITFYHESIFNIPKMNLGTFDIIDCYGVLHHLSDPDEGLRILEERLAVDGGMFLMLYSYYGRQGMYTMQETLGILNANKNISYDEEIRRGRCIYNNLLENNRVHVSGVYLEILSDPGFYDMYLHKQDRAYTIPELYHFIEQSGKLKIIDFYDSQQRYILNQPFKFSKNQSQKYAANELIFGHFIKNEIFVSRQRNSSASTDDFNNVPILQVKNFKSILSFLSSHSRVKKIQVITSEESFTPNQFILSTSKYTAHFLKLLCDPRKLTIGEIIENTLNFYNNSNKNTKILRDKITKALKKELNAFIHSGFILLHHKSFSDERFDMENVRITSVDFADAESSNNLFNS